MAVLLLVSERQIRTVTKTFNMDAVTASGVRVSRHVVKRASQKIEVDFGNLAARQVEDEVL
jgi:hypothetical protein